MKIQLLSLVFCFLVFGGCKSTEESSGILPPFSDSSINNASLEIIGNVVFYELEAGFYAVLDESTNLVYEPLNLPERFKSDGLKVIVEAQIQPESVSYRQIGELILIKSIKQR